jgi:NADPH:quinone reductase-like Zn-dependent oxidoreductase
VLVRADVEAPAPGPGEVLIRVRASSVNPIDWRIRNGDLRFFIRHPWPIILGVDLAGEVSAVGAAVTRLAVGDPVFAMSPNDLGAHAELVALPEALVVRKPAALSMEEAASVPAVALTALQGLRDKARLQPGQDLLVNGASGGVGMFAVQLGKVLGARVTGVSSAGNAAFVRGLGADEVIDYGVTDFATAGRRYHVVYDCVGNRRFGQVRGALHRGGVYVSTAGSPGLFLASALSRLGSRRARPIIVRSSGEDLAMIADLLARGAIRTVLDGTFPFAAVSDAHRRSQSGRARGKIVLSVS